MLPRSTHTRMEREAARGRIGGRTHEIQRLIGRSLRAVTDLGALGERSIWIDCDVLQADGGTRTASITGAWVALVFAVQSLERTGQLEKNPIRGTVAAVSAGVVDGVECLDLCYEEDRKAEVDMNFVMTDRGRFVEIQGTAEAAPFSKSSVRPHGHARLVRHPPIDPAAAGRDPPRVIVTAATTNPGKLRELAELLGSRLRVVPAPEPYCAPPEHGASYRENARIKARALFSAIGSSALADDSGLEVQALDGRPGVQSARYGIEAADRNRRLLEELRGRVGKERRARFRTAIVLVLADGRELIAEGHCEGEIAEAPRGSEGFGYDPLFLLPALGRTLAELTSEEKNRLSARAEAARTLVRELDRLGI